MKRSRVSQLLRRLSALAISIGCWGIAGDSRPVRAAEKPEASFRQCVVFDKPAELYAVSDAVFVGTVVSQRRTGSQGDHSTVAVATLQIDWVAKGEVAGRVEVGADDAFQLNRQYVVFAAGKPLSTTLKCHATELLSDRPNEPNPKETWLEASVPRLRESLIGTWRGTSTCTDRVAAPACADEDVVYEFAAGLTPGAVRWKADKLVAGKREPMGELDLAYDAAASCWRANFASPRVQSTWCVVIEYGVYLHGTASLVPGNQIIRNISARKTQGVGVVDATNFEPLDAVSWNGPWVFQGGVTSKVPIAALDSSAMSGPHKSIRVRLDDGSFGALSATQHACGPTENCEPYDCGCISDDDSFWITVADAQGHEVSRIHLWAAYGQFQVVPVDLVGGIGDEFLVFRVPNHSSPPIGYDLKIWKLGAEHPVDLGGDDRVANFFGTMPISCAAWRTLFYVDAKSTKPRAINRRTRFGANAECSISAGEDATMIKQLRRQSAIRFDTRSQRYVVK